MIACASCSRKYGATPTRIRVRFDGSVIWTALCDDCRKLDAPSWELAEWMGHADIQTTMRYLHYAPRAEDAALVAEAFAVEDDLGRLGTTSVFAGSEG